MHNVHNPAKIDMASASPRVNMAGVNSGKAQANTLRSTTVYASVNTGTRRCGIVGNSLPQ